MMRRLLVLAQPSLYDPSRAPSGKHTAWAYCHVPHGSSVDMTSQVKNQIWAFCAWFPWFNPGTPCFHASVSRSRKSQFSGRRYCGRSTKLETDNMPANVQSCIISNSAERCLSMFHVNTSGGWCPWYVWFPRCTDVSSHHKITGLETWQALPVYRKCLVKWYEEAKAPGSENRPCQYMLPDDFYYGKTSVSKLWRGRNRYKVR